MPHQAQVVAAAAEGHRTFLLADEPGLGKTAQALLAAQAADAFPLLAVVPNVVKTNWAREARLWTPDRSVTVVHGDGDLDVVSSNFGSRDWALFETRPGRTFAPRRLFPVAGGASCMTLHDRDDDGDLDMTGIDEVDDLIYLFDNTGAVAAAEAPARPVPTMMTLSFRRLAGLTSLAVNRRSSHRPWIGTSGALVSAMSSPST